MESRYNSKCQDCGIRTACKELPELKQPLGFDDEMDLYGFVSAVVKYKDGKETEKEKSQSAVHVLWCRLAGEMGAVFQQTGTSCLKEARVELRSRGR